MSNGRLSRIGLSLRQRSFGFLWQVMVIAGTYFVYMFVRRFMITDIEPVAFANAVKLVSFEFARGFLLEPQWQAWAIENSKALIIFLNWVYIFTFFPIIAVTAVIVFIKDRPRYFYYRNVILLSFVFALTLFAVFPLAPPRLMPEHGFVDTIQQFGPTWYGGTDMAAAIYYNVYAAMPSLHFGWTILLGVLFLRMGPKWLKVAGVIYPTMTFLAITLTGNHYILDAVGGGAVALASFLGYEILLRLMPQTRPVRAFARSAGVRAITLIHVALLRWKADTLQVFTAMKSLIRTEGLSNGRWKGSSSIYKSLAKGKRT